MAHISSLLLRKSIYTVSIKGNVLRPSVFQNLPTLSLRSCGTGSKSHAPPPDEKKPFLLGVFTTEEEHQIIRTINSIKLSPESLLFSSLHQVDAVRMCKHLEAASPLASLTDGMTVARKARLPFTLLCQWYSSILEFDRRSEEKTHDLEKLKKKLGPACNPLMSEGHAKAIQTMTAVSLHKGVVYWAVMDGGMRLTDLGCTSLGVGSKAIDFHTNMQAIEGFVTTQLPNTDVYLLEEYPGLHRYRAAEVGGSSGSAWPSYMVHSRVLARMLMASIHYGKRSPNRGSAHIVLPPDLINHHNSTDRHENSRMTLASDPAAASPECEPHSSEKVTGLSYASTLSDFKSFSSNKTASTALSPLVSHPLVYTLNPAVVANRMGVVLKERRMCSQRIVDNFMSAQSEQTWPANSDMDFSSWSSSSDETVREDAEKSETHSNSVRSPQSSPPWASNARGGLSEKYTRTFVTDEQRVNINDCVLACMTFYELLHESHKEDYCES